MSDFVEYKPNLQPNYSGLPPWHMWGNHTKLSTTQGFGGGFGGSFNVQLAKINFKRPDTWSFFFGAKLIDGDASASEIHVRVTINVIVGLGRTNFDTRRTAEATGFQLGFCTFDWVVPLGTVPGQQPGNTKYTTRVTSPLLDDTDTASAQQVEWIPASDIQCFADMRFISGTGAASAEVHSYFAPRSHMRPDWFVEQFLGQELNGT